MLLSSNPGTASKSQKKEPSKMEPNPGQSPSSLLIFKALIQRENIRFFKILYWRTITHDSFSVTLSLEKACQQLILQIIVTNFHIKIVRPFLPNLMTKNPYKIYFNKKMSEPDKKNSKKVSPILYAKMVEKNFRKQTEVMKYVSKRKFLNNYFSGFSNMEHSTLALISIRI